LIGRLTVEDLGWLARSLGGVRRSAGRLEARVALQGPLNDPTLEADMHLSDGALRPEAELPPFQALDLQARLTGRNLEIQSLKGEMGGAPFELSGRLENIFTLLENGRADLRLDGKNLLFYRSDALRLRADAKLTLSGPVSRMALAGGVVITDGFLGKNFGLLEGLKAGSAQTIKGSGIELFSIEAAPFSDTTFDVRITAAAPFQIKNNLARAAVRPDLRLTGAGRAPTLTGAIYCDPSTLYLPAGRMHLQSGLVRFEASDPSRPRLDLVGTARMLGYDITAVAEGPYDEPVVTLSSVPPLPDQELLMLVLTGQAPKTAGARTSEGGRSLNVAVFFGRDMIARIEGGDSTETLQSILERFDVEVGRFVTRAGDETVNAEFRLADDVLRGGDTLYLTGEKDIYDYYNAGIKIVFRFR
jgi:translocation and assembly module TamB